MSKASMIIRLLRPQQWAKNFFIFLPMFFGARIFDVECWKAALLMFCSFSLMASAVYCINDIVDVEADRLHPKKRFRPIALGAVAVTTAKAITLLLIVSSLFIGFITPHNEKILLILAGYLVLNIAYCLRLKRYDIIDVFIVSFGFVLRLMGGGVACGIELSPWIVLMTFLLALFLAFAKRRDDVVLHEQSGVLTRGNVVHYNLPFMNITLGLIGAITIVCYIMYSVNPEVQARIGSSYVYTTSIFVLAAILRYLQVAIVDMKSGSPTKILLNDRFIQGCIFLWTLLFLFLLYL